MVLLILADLSVLYPKLTGRATDEVEIIYVNITRVIDGDTFEASDFKVRLLGINTPEKKQIYFQEAKDFLQDFEGKTIALESYGKDKYGRVLGYVHYNKKLINLEILKNGLGSLYYYDKDKYYSDMEKAEASAQKREIGIWSKSKNYGCLELVELKWKENERCKNQEKIVLNNKCESMQVTFKDDATHIYSVELERGIFEKSFSCIWNDAGDSLYIWDDDGLLLFYRY